MTDLRNVFEKKQFLAQWKEVENKRDAAFDRVQVARAALRDGNISQEKRSQLQEAKAQAQSEYNSEEHTRLRNLARAQGFRVTWDHNSDKYDLAPLPVIAEDEDENKESEEE